MKLLVGLTSLMLSLGATMTAEAGQTLDGIKSKGFLACGVGGEKAGFSTVDNTGKFTGLDVDVCRAISAAIFGTPDNVKYVPLLAVQALTAVQTGEIDVLSRSSTWTLRREGQLGLLYGPVVFMDGQAFLVKKSANLQSPKQLSGASICVQPGTVTELTLGDYFRSNNLQLKTVVIESPSEVENAFFAGRCDVFTTDASALAGTRLTKAANPDDYVILPERISKEPLAPVVRQGDNQFFDIVRWSVFALLQGEEKGITSKNVDAMLKSEDPDIKRILGVSPGNGQAIGLDEKWAYNIVKTVGNYGEIFDRNLGAGSPLKLERGLNDLWTRGGLLYSPPMR